MVLYRRLGRFMAPSLPAKRNASESPISPPPVKRALQSTTTKSAVANFFTPISQKPKDRTAWSERSRKDESPATLLVGRYTPEADDKKAPKVRRKIAAFDLDSTLIVTNSGKKHSGSAVDWKWWDNKVPGVLRELQNDKGYQVVILSNQAGLTLHFDPSYKGPKGGGQKRVSEFKQKCSAVLSRLGLATSVYAATEKDMFRKPRIGMWDEMCEDYEIPREELDLASSFFVGDAGGRIPGLSGASKEVRAVAKDFSCSDRNFAHNVGIKYYTPEEYFLGEKPRAFARDFDVANFPLERLSQELFTKKNNQDLVLFCGPPGAGKSTFYWKRLKPLGYERVNQDILRSRDKCLQAAKEFLARGSSVAVDPETRSFWIELAKKTQVPIRCVWFQTPLYLCEHNDAVRALNPTLNPEDREGLPKVAFTGFASRYKAPHVREGFQDVVEIPFKFNGTEAEHSIWARYWM